MRCGGLACAARIACAGLVLLAPASFAQNVPDAGSALRELEQEPLKPPPPPPPPPSIQEPPAPAPKPAPEVRFVLKEVRISGNTVFEAKTLADLLHDVLEQEVGFKELSQAAERITAFYREHGYLLSRAYLPPQEIRDGVVQIDVLEVRHGKTVLDNRSRVKDEVILRYAEPLAGRLIEQGTLERRLLLIYDLSGVGQPKMVFRPGAHTGESDLAIELGESRAYEASVEADNYGNRYAGANRVSARAQLSSPSGLGDRIGVRFTKGEPGLEYWRLSYEVPVGGDGLLLGAAYSASSYRLGKDFSVLDASGKTAAQSASVSYPFVRSRPVNVYGKADFERRAMRDSIGATSLVTEKTLTIYSLAVTMDYRDTASVSVASLGYSHGRLNIESPLARAIDALTARTEGSSGKYTLSALRVQALTDRMTLAVSFTAQKAIKNLDSSEKFVLGGAMGVRAYPAGEAPGDSGWVLRAELRRSLYRPSLPGTIERFIFVDTGTIRTNEDPFGPGDNTRHLSALGVGARWELRDDFLVHLAVAHKLGGAVATSDRDEKLRAWVQAIKYF